MSVEDAVPFPFRVLVGVGVERKERKNEGAIAARSLALVGCASGVEDGKRTFVLLFSLPLLSALSATALASCSLRATSRGGEKAEKSERKAERERERAKGPFGIIIIIIINAASTNEGERKNEAEARTAKDERRCRADEPEEGRDRISGPRSDHGEL